MEYSQGLKARWFCLVWMACTAVASFGSWQEKVAPTVLAKANQGPTSFLILLTEQADLAPATQIKGKEAKGAWVYRQLTSVAERTQTSLLSELRQLDVTHQPFWIVNMIRVEGDADVLANLAQRREVLRIADNAAFSYEFPVAESGDNFSGNQLSWGVEKIAAPDVWAMGYTGQGVVIGGQDTGYSWTHPALREQYLGWDGANADHNYHWHDAIHSGGGSCGPDAQQPCDDGSHGTHTMGSMVGDDGLGNQTGVAPGARWIGCRNMDQGNGTPATYSECFQWFLAPTDLAGQGADPGRAPHVINNSWGCPGFEGCTDPNVMLAVVESARAAGIVVVVSAGNSGSGCSTVNTPAAIYDASFTVGSVSSTDSAASSSSRGPVSVDGSFRLKPDIAAPGVSIRSTIPGGGFGLKSGTSMAGPHVAGLVALMISADPMLAGEVDRIEEIIRQTALPLTTVQDCSGFPGDIVPNAVYGWGRIRADKAIEEVLGIRAPECSDYPEMLGNWPAPVMGFPDTNGNQRIDIQDLLPLASCPL